MPEFTVITPVRNGLPALHRCVGSVRGQAGVELEHIVRDGASTDGTARWLSSQQDLVSTTEADSGMYDAINKGLAQGSGQVISWLNADEQYLPGALDRVSAYLSANPAVDVVFGDFIVVDALGNPLAARRALPARLSYLLSGPLYTTSCTMFFRRHLKETGELVFDPSHRYVGDIDLVLRLLKSGARFGYMPGYLSTFEVNDANLSGHRQAIVEMADVYRVHRQGLASAVPSVLRAARWLEKLARGCYKADHVRYDFALTAEPSYRHLDVRRVGFKWTIATQRG